jgi:hypothetical protein
MNYAYHYEDLRYLQDAHARCRTTNHVARANLDADLSLMLADIRDAYTAAFRACWGHAFMKGISECHKRARVAEGLSIGIERLALRDLYFCAFMLADGVCEDHPALHEVLSPVRLAALGECLNTIEAPR